MMDRTIDSLKAKIRSLANKEGRDPYDLWQNLVLERFLVRLANSSYRRHFILKGAILLSKYIDLGRETRDLDFLGTGVDNDILELNMIFDQIAKIDVGDNFRFQNIKVTELKHPQLRYFGANIEATVMFGKSRFPLSIDIGFGDYVLPVQYSFPLTISKKENFFEDEVDLFCYPKEFIFAEKLETIFYWGSLNSRMKDFHDIFSLISADNSKIFANLGNIIKSVFNHRGTRLSLPIIFTKGEISDFQSSWQRYLRGLSKTHNLPADFEVVLEKINDWLSAQKIATEEYSKN